jgi:hypothetical protein
MRITSETANIFCLQNQNLKSRLKHRYQLTVSKFYTVSLNFHAINDVDPEEEARSIFIDKTLQCRQENRHFSTVQ